MAADPKLDLLRSVSLFNGLPSAELKQVLQLTDTVDLPAGRVLMREGERGHEAFVIASGSVGVAVGGTEVAQMGPGSVVGEMAILSEGPRTATVTTLEPTTVLVMGHREFHSLLDSSKALRQCVFDAMASRIRAQEARGAH
jgi:CRP/FNR family cyclic AMP-dependent transcriptional regulator